MKLLNLKHNLPHGTSLFSLLRYAIVAVLIFSFILITSARSYAEDPSAAIIRTFGGNKMVVREGDYRKEKPWKQDRNGNLSGELRRFKDTLEIPGDNRSGANLIFTSENTLVVEYAKLSIRTVPSKDNTEYRFPCGLARGRASIGWRRASNNNRDRACDDGVRVGPGVGKQSYQPNLYYRDGLQASKKILLAQSFNNDVIVVPPDSGSRFLEAVANENGAEIIALQGDILVKSDKHPQGRLIPEGNQYSYPQDTITPIDKNSIINSPAVQDFLNPNNWSSPDMPQRVADEVVGQLGELRTALGQGSPVVASNSGNNNNPGQSPTANPNNIAIVSGSGRITNSQFPAVVPVGTSVSQVSGAYNPSTNQILLDIEGRQAEISLNAPLTDSTPIPFTASRIIPRDWRDSSSRLSGSKFTHLVKGALIKHGIQTQGTLIKQGNQIQGKFSSQGRWLPSNPPVRTNATDGAIEGEFILTLQPGVAANTPVLRNFTVGGWSEVAFPVRGGW